MEMVQGGTTQQIIEPVSSQSTNAAFNFLPVLVIGWLAFLAALTIFTSNPLLLNNHQLKAADALWVAEIKDDTTGEVEILQDFRNTTSQLKSATIKNLQRSHIAVGKKFLLPVMVDEQGAYEIAPVIIKSQSYYPVYPWTPEIEQRLKLMMNQTEALDAHALSR